MERPAVIFPMVAHRSLQEFETLCLKQREEPSKQSNIEDFFLKNDTYYLSINYLSNTYLH